MITNRIKSLLARLRHFRGHGIHSPFVYSVVRNVMMEKTILGDGELYRELRKQGIGKRPSRQIQNLYVFCRVRSYDLFHPGQDHTDNRMTIVLPTSGDNVVEKALCERNEDIVVVLCHRNQLPKWRLCLDYAAEHLRLTIETNFFFIYFNSSRKPKQNFKL